MPWWTQEEALVLGAGTRTSDVLRLSYTDSYHRGRRGKYLRYRYDSIRVSPGIGVTDVRYLFDETIAADSDHALVVAEIELA